MAAAAKLIYHYVAGNEFLPPPPLLKLHTANDRGPTSSSKSEAAAVRIGITYDDGSDFGGGRRTDGRFTAF